MESCPMDPQAASYHIARDGNVLGKFTLVELAKAFAQGRVTVRDHYLIDGTTDWLQLSELRAMLERIETERLEEEKRIAAERARAEAERQEEERRKDAAAIEEANRARALRMAEAEKERKIAEYRQSIALTCGNCGKQFSKPTRTGDGKADLASSLNYLVLSLILSFGSWFCLKHSLMASGVGIMAPVFLERDSGVRLARDAENLAAFYNVCFYLALVAAAIFAWFSARHLIIGTVAKGMETYQGAKSSCPECGSGNFSPTMFS